VADELSAQGLGDLGSGATIWHLRREVGVATVQYVERFYSRVSTIYDLIYGLGIFKNGRDLAGELLKLFPGAQLLEVGVGTGLSIPSLPRNIEITAIDLSQKMLNQTRQRLSLLGRQEVQLYKMDATQLDFPDNSFDRILAAYFVSTVPDPVQAVLEMKRVCRPGGIILLVNHFHGQTSFVRFLERLLSPLFYLVGFRTDLDLDELMKATGLETERVERIDFLGHWKAVRCINPSE